MPKKYKQVFAFWELHSTGILLLEINYTKKILSESFHLIVQWNVFLVIL